MVIRVSNLGTPSIRISTGSRLRPADDSELNNNQASFSLSHYCTRNSQLRVWSGLAEQNETEVWFEYC